MNAFYYNLLLAFGIGLLLMNAHVKFITEIDFLFLLAFVTIIQGIRRRTLGMSFFFKFFSVRGRWKEMKRMHME
jgi:hypothetical protein